MSVSERRPVSSVKSKRDSDTADRGTASPFWGVGFRFWVAGFIEMGA